MKQRYDEKIRKTHKYEVGEQVFLRDPVGKQGISRKLLPEFYEQTFEIIRVEDEHNVRLRNCTTAQELNQTVHVDRLKPKVERLTPKPVGITPNNPDSETESDKENKEAKSVDLEQPVSIEDINYQIVEQKGSGDKRKFRIQWKNPSTGKRESCWDDIQHVTKAMLDKWEKTHGRSGRTLRQFKRSRPQRV